MGAEGAAAPSKMRHHKNHQLKKQTINRLIDNDLMDILPMYQGTPTHEHTRSLYTDTL